MYIHALVVLVMIICMVSVHRQHGEHPYQTHTLPQHIFHRSIVTVPVIGSQGQHTPGKGIHDIAVGRFHNDIPGKIGGQSPAVRKNIPEFLQLLLVRQPAKKQQIRDFFKPRPFSIKALHQFNTVIPPIPQPALTGRLHPVHHFKGLNSGHVGKSCYHAVPVLVAKTSLHFIFVKHLRRQTIRFPAQFCIISHQQFVLLQ